MPFTTLIDMLGKEATRRFLKVARSQLQHTQQALVDSLQQHDWQTAAAIAHKLSATAHFYESPALLELLTVINSQNPQALQLATIIPALQQAFQHIDQRIDQFII